MHTFNNVCLGSPVVDYVVLESSHVVGHVGPENGSPVGREGLLDLISPVHLQVPVPFDPLDCHERFDGWPQVPTASEDLVSSQMNVGGISKEEIYFSDGLFHQLVDFILADVELVVIAFSLRTKDADIFSFPLFTQTP